MRLTQAVKFLEKLRIRDRDSGRLVPFRLNPNQHRFIERLKEKREAKGLPLWAISVKSRRVGVSSLTEGLFLCHALSNENANNKIVAHLDDSVNELFGVPLTLAKDLPFAIPKPTQERIIIPHRNGDSVISIATAGQVAGGRGAGYSALHLSEAAFYRSPEAFVSLLNSVPHHPSTITIIESTANGQVGPGQTFYEYWMASERGETDFTPIFLSWLDDPACIRNPDELKRPCPPEYTVDEPGLRKHLKATDAQLAWRRWCIINKCQGYVETLRREYPTTPDECFIASGDPAFTHEELLLARQSLRDGTPMEVIDGTPVSFRPGGNGDLIVWAQPQKNHHYYLGVDAAQGEGEGDFAAITVQDGTTMEVAARYSARVTPKSLARIANYIGRYYNNAMMTIELTGGWGDAVQVYLRDGFNYPNFYVWKGRDDDVHTAKKRNKIGWATNATSRAYAFTQYREAIRELGLEVRDKVTVAQMQQAQREMSGRWTVTKGHDDVLMSALLANIACAQWPPPKRLASKSPEREASEKETERSLNFEEGLAVEGRHIDPTTNREVQEFRQRHSRKVMLDEMRDKNSMAAREGKADLRVKRTLDYI